MEIWLSKNKKIFKSIERRTEIYIFVSFTFLNIYRTAVSVKKIFLIKLNPSLSLSISLATNALLFLHKRFHFFHVSI